MIVSFGISVLAILFFKDLNRLILRIGIVYKFERHLFFCGE